MENTTSFPCRFEKKFLVPHHQADFLAHWLEHLCVPDPRYPGGIVNSLYYDTPGLELCASKNRSDFRKTKVRVRWYGDSAELTAPAFLEAKSKEGAQVQKARAPIEQLDVTRFSLADELPRELQVQTEAMSGLPLGMLFPVCVIKYLRRRYVDPRTGWRVSLDENIRVPASNQDLHPFTEHAAFHFAVLELKGTGQRPGLPRHLLPHPDFMILPENFSKYYEGVELLKLTGAMI